MFRTVPLYIIRSFVQYTQQWFMSYRFADSLRAGWYIPLLCVHCKTPDDVQRNCSNHEEIYSKNKNEKLVHLVGFIIWIYRDARSHERQSTSTCYSCLPEAKPSGSKHVHVADNKTKLNRAALSWYTLCGYHY